MGISLLPTSHNPCGISLNFHNFRSFPMNSYAQPSRQLFYLNAVLWLVPRSVSGLFSRVLQSQSSWMVSEVFLQHFRISVCYGSLHAFRMDVNGVTSKEDFMEVFFCIQVVTSGMLKRICSGCGKPQSLQCTVGLSMLSLRYLFVQGQAKMNWKLMLTSFCSWTKDTVDFFWSALPLEW